MKNLFSIPVRIAMVGLFAESSVCLGQTTCGPESEPGTVAGQNQRLWQEFPISEITNIRLDLTNGTLEFSIRKTHYRYFPSAGEESLSSKVSAVILVLSEMRKAKAIVIKGKKDGSSDVVFVDGFILRFKSL